ncbi:MAG: CocE/NonD family hydrolase, partial [Candidatus Acidiferrales bacterium]
MMKTQVPHPGFTKWLLAIVAVLWFMSAGAKPPAREIQASDSKPLYSGIRIEKTWIPMPDGVKLAVTLYLPEGAKPAEKFPAILEYIPYRKDDWQESWDYELHSYYVLRGYVSA